MELLTPGGFSPAGAAPTGWGTALPERVLENAELAERVGVSEGWIEARTGIRRRHIAGPTDTSATLATDAARAALSEAGLSADAIDMVIVATSTPDYQLPATAPLVQAALGATNAGAFDVGAACTGFLCALSVARSSIVAGDAQRVLVCGADVLSRFTDPSDARTCVLFGDGAGAVVVEARPGAAGLGPFLLRSEGSRPELLYISRSSGLIHMEGREVYRRAVDGMSSAVSESLSAAGLAVADVDLVVAHQANARILNAVAERLGIAPEKVTSNIATVGNTSAASIPLAVVDARARGSLFDGAIVVFTAFGAGFVWGAGVMTWVEAAQPRREQMQVAHA